MMSGFPGGESSHKMKPCVENIVPTTFPPAAAAVAQFTTGASASISATPDRSVGCGKPSGFAFLKSCLSRATLSSLSWLFSLLK